MKDADFYVYNAGHGVCTLLTGTKYDNKPYCGVFDCGSKAPHEDCSFQTVISDMITKFTDSGSKWIDDVVISHQDTDHWEYFLDFFCKLNNIRYSFEKYAFRLNINNWACKSSGNDLHILMNNSYFKKTRKLSNGRYYTYDADASYIDGTDLLSSFNLYIEKEAEDYSIYWLNVIFSEHFLSVTCDGNTLMETSVGEDYPLTVEVLLDYVWGQIPDFFIASLLNVKSSFLEQTRRDLIKELSNCATIKYPIKRVIMGGDYITYRYDKLKTLLCSMANCYDDGSFLWMQRGAYIIMDEGGITDIMIEDFPDAATVEFNENDEAIMHNLTSVVVQFNIDNQNVLLLPGDVTAHAFTEIGNQIANIPCNSLKLFLAPHHGSDHTNFANVNFEPFIYLLRIIQQLHSQCNLVISGYNQQSIHPGKRFITEASKLMGNYYSIKHSYAWAYGLRVCRPSFLSFIDFEDMDLFSTPDPMLHICEDKKRIFTTNLLTNRDKYYNLYNGEIYSSRDIEIETVPVDLTHNLRHRLPPDDSFI